MRQEYEIRAAIKSAKAEKKKSADNWAEFFEDACDRPPFTTEVYGITLNCAECQEFDSFIKGLRYALGEDGC